MEIIHRNDDGSYTYLYNLKQYTEQGLDGPEEKYSYTEIFLYGYPNVKDCILAVIRKHLTIDEEFDLINSYNSPDKTLEDTDKYMNYLDLLKEIKTNVKQDFHEAGIY